jgi:hypothetical protein
MFKMQWRGIEKYNLNVIDNKQALQA